MDTDLTTNKATVRTRWVWVTLGALLVAAALGLWAKNGSAMFVDMLIAGWTACFG